MIRRRCSAPHCHLQLAEAQRRRQGPLAKKLGAQIYIDSTKQNAAEELTKLGGAKVILSTVTDAKTMSSAIPGLGIDGKLLVVGASGEPIEAPPFLLIGARRSISSTAHLIFVLNAPPILIEAPTTAWR